MADDDENGEQDDDDGIDWSDEMNIFCHKAPMKMVTNLSHSLIFVENRSEIKVHCSKMRTRAVAALYMGMCLCVVHVKQALCLPFHILLVRHHVPFAFRISRPAAQATTTSIKNRFLLLCYARHKISSFCALFFSFQNPSILRLPLPAFCSLQTSFVVTSFDSLISSSFIHA